MKLSRISAIVGLLLCAAASAPAQGFEGIFDEPSEAAGLAVSLHGEVGVEFEYFTDDEWDSEAEARPSADVTLAAETPAADAVLSLHLETSEATGGALVGNVVDEAYVRSYFGFGHLTAGLMRVEWGTGDGLHAIDPLNATDQSGGPTSDYLDSRVPEAMVDMTFYLGGSATADFVYKPFFHPTAAALTGRWAVVDAASIPGFSGIEPVDVRTLEYSQAAARLAGSVGPADLGVVYYYGFMPEAGYEYTSTFTGTDPFDPTHYTITTDIVYTRGQLFGFEGAAALGPFTLRAETGYWLSEDTDGSVPELYNSRLVYLGGFDVTIPHTTAFFSAQVLGSYTFEASDLGPTDVDSLRLYDDATTSHLVVAALDVPFARDTAGVRLAGLYSIEASGYLVMPQLTWTIADGVELGVNGLIVGGEQVASENSPYYAWRNNDNVSLQFRYQF